VSTSNNLPFKHSTGCFEHYPNPNKHDSTFTKYSKAIEWLGSYDLLYSGMRSEREYGLMNCLSYMIVPFYPHDREGLVFFCSIKFWLNDLIPVQI